MMAVLFSCVGTTDPIRGLRDGSMLHIVRHYRPSDVILFLSAEMSAYNQKDQRFQKCFEFISENWGGYSPKVQYLEAKTADPTDFDAIGQELLSAIDDCANSFPGEEILLNLSSGTPQMKMVLAQAAVNTRYHARGIQVKNPELRSGRTSRTNDDDYDIEASLLLNDDEVPNCENRCSEPRLLVIQREQQKERIRTMLDLRDYSAIRNTSGILPPELKLLIIHLDERNHLNKDNAVEYGKKARQANKALFPLYINTDSTPGNSPLMDTIRMTDYYLMLRNLQRTKSYTSLVLRLNPFIIRLQECFIDRSLPCISFRELLENRNIHKNVLDPVAFQNKLPDLYKKVNDEMIRLNYDGLDRRPVSMRLCNVFLAVLKADPNMLQFFENIENLNWQKRNASAHELAEVTEDDIYTYSFMTSAQIIKRLSEYLQVIYPRWNSEWASIYDRCNQFILDQL